MPKPPRQASLPGMEPPADPHQPAPPAQPGDNPPACVFASTPAARGLAPPDPATAPSIADWTVYVIDSHSLIFQVFHAMGELTSPRGEPVNAVYGFARDLIQI